MLSKDFTIDLFSLTVPQTPVLDKPCLRLGHLGASERRIAPALYLNALALEILVDREEVRDLAHHVRINF